MAFSEVYERLFNEDEDERVCKDISDDACQTAPSSFFLILISQFFSKLGDAFSNIKTILPWLMSSIGAPPALIGLLVPIRESGSLIPQLLIGGLIRKQPMRKWFYVLGSALQALSLALMALSAYFLEGTRGGLAIVGLLVVFSISRSLCSIASKDVKGKTIPRTRRGRLSGYSASLAGFITLLAAFAMYFEWLEKDANFGLLLVIAACFFAVSSITYAGIVEYKGATDGGKNGVAIGLQNLSLIKTDPTFRAFIIVRAFLMSSSLSAPYFILLAGDSEQTRTWSTLGFFVGVSGLSSLISGPIWGKYADLSSRLLMRYMGLATAILCLIAAAVAHFSVTHTTWVAVGLFFLLSVVHQGVRLGRKTYVLDIAQGNQRTDYVAVGNTLIGILLLVTGVLTAGLAQLSNTFVFIGFAIMSILAFAFSHQLPKVSD